MEAFRQCALRPVHNATVEGTGRAAADGSAQQLKVRDSAQGHVPAMPLRS